MKGGRRDVRVGVRRNGWWGLYTTCGVTVYVALSIALGADAGSLIGPLSIIPVATAAWAFGARGGGLVALALTALYLGFFYDDAEARQMSMFIHAITLPVGLTLGLLFDRLRSTLEHQRACEARYERAARGANDGLWEWELATGHTYFSERFCELLGHTKDQISPHVTEWLSRVHPEDRADLDAAIAEHLAGRSPRLDHEHRVRTADGSYLWVEARGVASSSDGGPPTLLTGWTTDVSARRSQEQELRFHAFRDPLTGLANRSLFADRLEQALVRCRELHGARIGVLLIDLDRFKRVNDSLGHAAGDGLLLAVAARLRACVRSEDTVARLGGDEFAILLPQVTLTEDAIEVAERVRHALHEPVSVKGRSVTTGSSIGIVVSDSPDTSPQDMVRDADTAMYRAKAQGRNQWAMFDPAMRDRAMTRLTLENELRAALVRGQFEVFYQPIVDHALSFVGVEALPRWRHPQLGLLLPRDFIELAEETGLIMDLGDLVLSEACAFGRRIDRIVGGRPFSIHVNLSPKQIRRPDLIERIDAVLSLSGLSPARLCIEVTEDLILDEAPAGSVLFEAMRSRGIQLCMDDFGTGYSSLSYLHRFRVDYLKVETAFVHGAESREGGVQIVRSLVNLAKNLGVTAIAEGVETKRQWELLKSVGCPRAQGFFFAEPRIADEMARWLEERSAECA